MKFTTSLMCVSSTHVAAYVVLWWCNQGQSHLVVDGPKPRPSVVTMVKPRAATETKAPQPSETPSPAIAKKPMPEPQRAKFSLPSETRAAPPSVDPRRTSMSESPAPPPEQVVAQDATPPKNQVSEGQRGTLGSGEVQMFITVQVPSDALILKDILQRQGHELAALAEREGNVFQAMLPRQGYLELCGDQPTLDEYLRERHSSLRRWIAVDVYANPDAGFSKLFRNAFDRYRDQTAGINWRTYLVLSPKLTDEIDRFVLQACNRAALSPDDLGQAWVTLRIGEAVHDIEINQLIPKLRNENVPDSSKVSFDKESE